MVTKHNLPLASTPFIGRTHELADIAKLIVDPDCRLLTLVGPGGIGKTRLALEAVGELETYTDGVYFAPLQPLSSPDFIVSTIAEALNFQFCPGEEPKQQLLDYLRDKDLLLVLDNFEHLLNGVGIVNDILIYTPHVKVLATSRERLNLSSETIFNVGGMRVPDAKTTDDVADFSAVRLFIQNARRVRSNFTVEHDDLIHLAHICRLVGGMPLALLLAASWIEILSLKEIAEEIERGTDLLETEMHDLPERHRSIQATLDYSWKQLAESEREVFEKLSVFQGGFTREAAQEVTGASLKTLAALVNKSFVGVEGGGRYNLHELMRQYGEKKLIMSGGLEAAQDAHSAFFGQLMSRHECDIKFQRQVQTLNEIEQDFINVCAAWQWAAERQNHNVIKLMAEALNWFCDLKAYFTEGEELFRTASEHFMALDDVEPHLTYNRLRARRTRMIVIGLLSYLTNIEELIAELEVIVAENRQFDDLAETAFSIQILGLVLTKTSDEANQYLSYFEESFRIYRDLNDPYYMSDILVWISFEQPDPQQTMQLLHEARELKRQVGDENGEGYVLNHLARYAFGAHRFAESEQYFQEAVASQRRRADIQGLNFTLLVGAEAKMLQGEFQEARNLGEECLSTAIALNNTARKKAALALLGLILIVNEDYTEGKRLFQTALSISVPPIYAFGHPELDTAIGLAIAAHQDNHLDLLRLYYQQVAEYPCFWDATHRLTSVATMALLLLDAEGKTQEAVEVTAHLCTAFQEAEKPVVIWLDKWQVLNRLRDKWQNQLGAAAYTATWECGTSLDLKSVIGNFMPNQNQAENITQLRLPTPQPMRDGLTERELEVLGLVAYGHSNREIARELVLSLGTVKWYISQIYSKLSVGSRTQAVAHARELNILS
ncbi:MAG: AAA family ATPase [Chitinophagaceae bacterium]|nr:AAA family ATPase [Anaerolineae bacterium]